MAVDLQPQSPCDHVRQWLTKHRFEDLQEAMHVILQVESIRDIDKQSINMNHIEAFLTRCRQEKESFVKNAYSLEVIRFKKEFRKLIADINFGGFNKIIEIENNESKTNNLMGIAVTQDEIDAIKKYILNKELYVYDRNKYLATDSTVDYFDTTSRSERFIPINNDITDAQYIENNGCFVSIRLFGKNSMIKVNLVNGYAISIHSSNLIQIKQELTYLYLFHCGKTTQDNYNEKDDNINSNNNNSNSNNDDTDDNDNKQIEDSEKKLEYAFELYFMDLINIMYRYCVSLSNLSDIDTKNINVNHNYNKREIEFEKSERQVHLRIEEILLNKYGIRDVNYLRGFDPNKREFTKYEIYYRKKYSLNEIIDEIKLLSMTFDNIDTIVKIVPNFNTIANTSGHSISSDECKLSLDEWIVILTDCIKNIDNYNQRNTKSINKIKFTDNITDVTMLNTENYSLHIDNLLDRMNILKSIIKCTSDFENVDQDNSSEEQESMIHSKIRYLQCNGSYSNVNNDNMYSFDLNDNKEDEDDDNDKNKDNFIVFKEYKNDFSSCSFYDLEKQQSLKKLACLNRYLYIGSCKDISPTEFENCINGQNDELIMTGADSRINNFNCSTWTRYSLFWGSIESKMVSNAINDYFGQLHDETKSVQSIVPDYICDIIGNFCGGKGCRIPWVLTKSMFETNTVHKMGL